MKLNTTSSHIEIQGELEQGSFGIKQSPKAFQILSSGLYSNKPMAIVRELSANAADAHVLNGNQAVPFEIKLPNRLDSQFYLKDFGPGLSHDQVMRLYTTYFDSTKSESNDFIGGLGLGSKSPFAYTDAFTVESRQNGFTRTYSAFVAEKGIPQIVLLGGATPTEEPDGLTVGFPVSPNDYDAFAKEAKRILPWFSPMPNVLGVALEPLAPPLLRSENLAVYENIPVWHANSHRSATFVKMGHILYPLDWDAAGLSDDKDMLTLLRNPQRSSAFVFDVPIGSVEVAASREGLQYDRSSKQNLKVFAETLMSTLGGIIERAIIELQSKYKPFEAQARVAKMQSDWGFAFKTAFDIFSKRGLHYPALKNAAEIRLPTKDYTHFTLELAIAGERSLSKINSGSFHKSVSAGNVPVSIMPGSSFMFVECDTKGHIGATKGLMLEPIKEDYFNNSRYNSAVVIVPNNLKHLTSPAYIAERDAFIESVGSPPLHSTSEYISAKRTSFGRSAMVAKELVEAYPLHENCYSRNLMTRAVIDVNDITSWVSYQGIQHQVEFPKKDGTRGQLDAYVFSKIFTQLVDVAKKLNLPDPGKLQGITSKYEKRVLKTVDPQKNAFEWVSSMLQNPEVLKHYSVSNPVVYKDPDLSWSKQRVASEFISNIQEHKKFFKDLGGNWALLADISSEKPEILNISKVLSAFLEDKGFKPEVSIKTVDTSATYFRLFSAMPMLALALRSMETGNNKTLLKDIKNFLSSKNNSDIGIVYGP